MIDESRDEPVQVPTFIVVDEAARCIHTAHVWSLDFVYGDTCACGRFYILKNPAGEVSIEVAS